jgi:hypothetical protein
MSSRRCVQDCSAESQTRWHSALSVRIAGFIVLRTLLLRLKSLYSNVIVVCGACNGAGGETGVT